MIAGCGLVALLLAIAYVWTATPGYQSTAQLMLDPRPHDLIAGALAPSGLGSSAVGADTALVESQLSLIDSDTALDALIARFHLLDDPEFNRPKSASLLSSVSSVVKRLLYGPNYASFNQPAPGEQVLQRLHKAIVVRRDGDTYLVTVTATSESPQKAADLANGLARIYFQQQQQAADEASTQAVDALEARLAGLKADADAAAHAVEDYRAAHGLLAADNLPIGQQQLRDLATQATQAAADTQAARSALDQARQLAAAPSAGALAGNALTSPAALELRTELDQAASEAEALSATLGPKHPQLVAARSKVKSLETALRAEFARIVRQAQTAYDGATTKERALKAALAGGEARQATANTATVELTALSRDAAAKAAVYQSFLDRATQLRKQVALPNTTARIVSPARPSATPSQPRVPLIVGLAVVVGLALGTGLAWLRHILGGTTVVRRSRPVARPAPAAAAYAGARPAADPRRAAHAAERPRRAPLRKVLADMFR